MDGLRRHARCQIADLLNAAAGVPPCNAHPYWHPPRDAPDRDPAEHRRSRGARSDSYQNAYTAKPLTDDERIALDTASALAADR
jgi:hypothetical protein